MPARPTFPASRSSFRILRCALVALASLQVLPALAAERFSLDVPGDASLHSDAVLHGETLTITDSTGRSFIYGRAARFDSQDGQLLGFFSPVANQTVRWPASGIGRFLIGDALGRQFRESAMTITPLGGNRGRPAAPRPVDPVGPVFPEQRQTRRPTVPPPLPRPPRGDLEPDNPRNFPDSPRFPAEDVRETGRRRLSRSPSEAALIAGPGEVLTAAYIDRHGQLQMYEGWNDRWRERTRTLRDALVPGAPLLLQQGPRGQLPTVYTVGRRGELLEILNGQQSRILTNRRAFTPGAHLAFTDQNLNPSLVLIDDRGRLTEIGLDDGSVASVDISADRYSPGAPIAVAETDTGSELFVIDRRGTLVNYRKSRGRWEGPDAIARGFSPEGHVSAVLAGSGQAVELIVASVDAQGLLQAFRLGNRGWEQFPVGQVLLPAGASIQLTTSSDGLHLAAVNREGRWLDWRLERRGGLVPVELGRGFPAAAPVSVLAHGDHLHAVAVDLSDRLITATDGNNGWNSVVNVPGFDFSPRLVRREVNAGAALDAVQIQFSNPSNEEVIVKLIDELAPTPPVEFRIPPNQAVRQLVKRDPTGVIRESWLIPGPGGWVEEVREVPVPAPVRYRVVVYANRTTYSYIDRRAKPGPLQDFNLQTPVSLGTFRLPPGATLQDGDVFDVYREAAIRQNPGAAAIVDPLGP